MSFDPENQPAYKKILTQGFRKSRHSTQRLCGLNRTQADLLWAPFVVISGIFLLYGLMNGLGVMYSLTGWLLGSLIGIGIGLYVGWFFIGMIPIKAL